MKQAFLVKYIYLIDNKLFTQITGCGGGGNGDDEGNESDDADSGDDHDDDVRLTSRRHRHDDYRESTQRAIS